jgi:hypothetical protein
MDIEANFTSPSSSAEIIMQTSESTKDPAPSKRRRDLPRELGEFDRHREPENSSSSEAPSTGENGDGIKAQTRRVKARQGLHPQSSFDLPNLQPRMFCQISPQQGATERRRRAAAASPAIFEA